MTTPSGSITTPKVDRLSATQFRHLMWTSTFHIEVGLATRSRVAIKMGDISRISARLRALILMLSSDQDGEVVNAARLIGATLRSQQLDWHDLAKALLEKPQAYFYESWDDDDEEDEDDYEPPKPPPTPPPPRHRPKWRKASTDNGSICGEVGPGYNCTIFKSRHNNWEWCAVVNVTGGKAVWYNRFRSVEEAKAHLIKLYD